MGRSHRNILQKLQNNGQLLRKDQASGQSQRRKAD
jgi:hypothetical protein